MKKLFLIRHAKSSWNHEDLADLERPLNKRGKRDAPFMGKLLKKEKIRPDAIFTSPAKRAITTAEIFAEELGFPKKKIIVDNTIYESGIKELYHLINSLPVDFKSVLIFGHNPAFTNFVNHLGDKQIDNMPTCSIVGIKFESKNWGEIERGDGKIFMFEYPKKYFA